MEEERLYIRLSRPNNEYKDGKLVFESSLNMSLNFGVFTCNPLFSDFKGKLYLEVTVTFSERRLWLVEQMTLRVFANDEEIKKRFYELAGNVTGHNVEEFDDMDPKVAWECLCKLSSLELKYGWIWTNRKYLPTEPKEKEDFSVSHDSEARSWSFSERKSWSDIIFEVQIDEWGRPIFRFRPDNSGYPPTMECLLSDFENFLFMHRNNTGDWTLNTTLHR